MHRISLNWFYVLYNQFKGGNQYNQVLLKNQSKEQIEHALHGFQQIDYGRAIIYFDNNEQLSIFKKQPIAATT